MEAKIQIKNFTINAILGVLAKERQNPQKILLDLELWGSMEKAMASDSIDQAIDYVRVLEICKQTVVQGRFHLIEACAAALTKALFCHFPLDKIRLRVKKTEAIKEAKYACFELLQSQKEVL